MDDEARTQFGLKPGSLGRHDLATVGNVDDLLHGHGIEGQSHLHLATVNTTFQFAQAADTANEVDALVGTQVGDAQDVAQDIIAADGYVEHADGVVVVISAFLGSQ